MKPIYYFGSRILATALTILLLFACNPDKKEDPEPSGAYQNGFFIVNEGGYNASNASISFYNRTTGGTENNVFQAVNGMPLGDIAQSMTVHESAGFIVLSSSNKIEVVDAPSMKSEATITGLQIPRYVAVANTKAFVTEYISYTGKGQVRSFDLSSYTLGSPVQVGALPEQILYSGGKIFVANGGSWYNNNGDSTVTIIDAETEDVIKTVTVGYSPTDLVKDAEGNIWVLCIGKQIYGASGIDPDQSKPGSLVKLDGNGNVLRKLDFPSPTVNFPSNLAVNSDGTKIYYNYFGNTYAMDHTATGISTTPLINKSFYGLGIDPATGNILGADAVNFTDNSYVLSYTAAGSFIDTLHVGIGPNGFAFP